MQTYAVDQKRIQDFEKGGQSSKGHFLTYFLKQNGHFYEKKGIFNEKKAFQKH